MLSRQLTMTDLCRVTGYTRHQIHGLLKLAFPARSSKGERFAREFRSQDLLLVTAITELETRFRIKRSGIALVAKRLAQVLSGPRALSRRARLVVAFDPPKVIYVPDVVPLVDGVVMSLGPIFERVDTYVANAGGAASQEPLRLGPTVLRTAAKRSSA
jgi:hypothetical protein